MWISKGVYCACEKQFAAILLVSKLINPFFRFFLESKDAYRFYFGAKFFWNNLSMACSVFLMVDLVRDIHLILLNGNPGRENFLEWVDFVRCFFSPSSLDISTFWVRWYHDLVCMWKWIFKYFCALFIRKIGYGKIWSTAKLFIRIRLDKFTTQIAKVFHFNAGKWTATTLLWRIWRFDFEFGIVYKCK